MIQLRIKELMAQRGVKSRLSAMTKAGISQAVAQKYLGGSKQWILLEHVGILCLLLRCTPNDLFEWTPDTPADDYPENPLQAIRQKPSFDLGEKLKGMSLEEIKRRFGED